MKKFAKWCCHTLELYRIFIGTCLEVWKLKALILFAYPHVKTKIAFTVKDKDSSLRLYILICFVFLQGDVEMEEWWLTEKKLDPQNEWNISFYFSLVNKADSTATVQQWGSDDKIFIHASTLWHLLRKETTICCILSERERESRYCKGQCVFNLLFCSTCNALYLFNIRVL